MNTPNNKRRQASRERIEKEFTTLLQTRELSQITVSDICKRTGLNRSTFYANYQDIYDLADNIRKRLELAVDALYAYDAYKNCGIDYLRLFRHIQSNQLFYKTYFKLGYDQNSVDLSLLDEQRHNFPQEHLAYHVEFHKAGLNAILKKWLAGGCQESPETIVQILESEYRGRSV